MSRGLTRSSCRPADVVSSSRTQQRLYATDALTERMCRPYIRAPSTTPRQQTSTSQRRGTLLNPCHPPNSGLKIVRRSSGSIVTWRRAQIVLWSAQGLDLAQIAPLAFTSEDRVRAVIHNFNADGFDSLYPRYAGG